MEYTLPKPCTTCPFLKGTTMLLRADRIKEISRMMLDSQGGEFPCHKTTEAGGASGKKELHCAGALAYAEKQGTATQMMRICERIGMYDHTKVEPFHDLVWDDEQDWLEGGVG